MIGAEATRRLEVFAEGLDTLLSVDERRGEDRFFLRVGKAAVAHQVALGLEHDLPFVLMVAGESASGKTTLVDSWKDKLSPLSEAISMDNYYRDNSAERAKYTGLDEFYRNFDVDMPEALDLELAAQHLNDLARGRSVALPKHDIATGISTLDAVPILPARFVLMEGLFALNAGLAQRLKQISHWQVFVDAPGEEIRNRWFARIAEMAETTDWKVPEAERPFYFDRVRTAAENHVLPTKASADIVLNGQSLPEYRDQQLSCLSEIMMDALVW